MHRFGSKTMTIKCNSTLCVTASIRRQLHYPVFFCLSDDWKAHFHSNPKKIWRNESNLFWLVFWYRNKYQFGINSSVTCYSIAKLFWIAKQFLNNLQMKWVFVATSSVAQQCLSKLFLNRIIFVELSREWMIFGWQELIY